MCGISGAISKTTTRRMTDLDDEDYGFWSVEEYDAWEREWGPD